MRILLLLVSIPLVAALKWTECSKDSSTTSISLARNEAVGIRSYDWPNSMTKYGTSTPRFNIDCGFKFDSTAGQNLSLVFLNARVGLFFASPIKEFLGYDTNRGNVTQNYIPHASSSFNFVVRMISLNTWDWEKWAGYEAIVSAFDDESKCPFETADTVVEVDHSNPTFVASFWHLDTTVWLPARRCVWRFKPKQGETLKMAFTVFTLSVPDEVLTLYSDNKEVFRLTAFDSNVDLPHRAFYTNSSFRLEYKRNNRRTLFGQFFAVVSAFEEKPAEESAFKCPFNTTMTLETTTKITNNGNLRNVGYVVPYANNQECNWQLQTVPGKEVRLFTSVNDFERCCDVATLNLTKRLVDITKPIKDYFVNAIRGNEVATIHWRSDGDSGRAGFSVTADVLDCSCGASNIDLTNDSPLTAFGPAHGTQLAYCRNMSCTWSVSIPPKTALVLTMFGDVRGCALNQPIGDTLSILETTSQSLVYTNKNCINDLPPRIFSFSDNLTLLFHSSDFLPVSTQDDTPLSFLPQLVSYSNFTSKGIRVLKDANDFAFFDCTTLNVTYTSQTFQLGPNMTSNQLQFYILSTPYSVFSGLYVIDGTLDDYVSITEAIHYSSHVTQSQSPAFVSKTGIITLVRMVFGYVGQAKILVKVFDESRDCSEFNPLYLGSDYGAPILHTYTAYSTTPTQQHCAITVYVELMSTEQYYAGLDLVSWKLEGSNSSVKVFPGVGISKTPFYDFNTTTMSRWNQTLTLGQIFTILIPIKASYTFTASRSFATNAVSYLTTTFNGVFMSPFYPFGSQLNGTVNYAQSLYGPKIVNVEFDVKIEKLSPQSTIEVYRNSSLYLSFNSLNETSKVMSYSTGESTNVTFKYSGPTAEKGFFLRFRAQSNEEKRGQGGGSSTSFLSVLVIVLAVVVSSFQ